MSTTEIDQIRRFRARAASFERLSRREIVRLRKTLPLLRLRPREAGADRPPDGHSDELAALLRAATGSLSGRLPSTEELRRGARKDEDKASSRR